jgi:hypothetical protein
LLRGSTAHSSKKSDNLGVQIKAGDISPDGSDTLIVDPSGSDRLATTSASGCGGDGSWGTTSGGLERLALRDTRTRNIRQRTV